MGFYGKQQEVEPREMDPLYSQSGAQPMREGIFNALPGMMIGATAAGQDAANAARRGAGQMGAVGQFGRDVMSGGYLKSPVLDRSLESTRAASDQAAAASQAEARAAQTAQQRAVQSQFSRSGQTFGTANQLAQEGTTAALEAQLDRTEAGRQAQLAATEAQTQAENYARERGYQMQAPAIVSGAASKPVELLQAVPGMTYSGISPAVEVIRGLASGAPVVNPNTYYKPGAGDYVLQGLGAAGSLAGAAMM